MGGWVSEWGMGMHGVSAAQSQRDGSLRCLSAAWRRQSNREPGLTRRRAGAIVDAIAGRISLVALSLG